VKKHIYIYSPSSAVRDKAGFKRGIKRLESQGHEVEIDTDALARHQRFAGDDETRLAGIQRLSDFTAFQMALLAKTGAMTWAGPALDDFGAKEPDDIMEACFDDLVTGQGEGTGWQLPKSAINLIAASARGVKAGAGFTIKDAVFWGGNLAILSALVGTPYLPAVKGGILFVEDVGEHPYRVERMLTQLLQAGILAQQKVIIFGQFTNYKLAPNDKGFKLDTVMAWLQGQVKARVLTGLPFGHVPTKVLLPVGCKTTLVVEDRDAFLLWGHQH
jgi:muramoyltetrapeptide carboxypeptidase